MGSPFSDFIASRRSQSTRLMYEEGIKLSTGDPEEFLKLARADRRLAEDRLIGFIMSKRDKVKGVTISNYVAPVRSFLEDQDVHLNWKRVNQTIPPKKRVSSDRPPGLEELRKALLNATLREKMVLLVMASSGIRVGAWGWLQVGDVEFGTPTRIRVYRGEPEEYSAFITPEAEEAVRAYLDARRRAGEEIDASSVLVRDKWDDRKGARGRPLHLTTSAVRVILWTLWKRSGVWKGGGQSEFKVAHGLRKLAKTQMAHAGLSSEDTETLLGHVLTYYKPSLEHLKEQYLRAIPALSIDDRFRLKLEMEAKEKEHGEAWKDLRLEVLTLKDENQEIRQTQSAILDAITKGDRVDTELMMKLLGFKKPQAGQVDKIGHQIK